MPEHITVLEVIVRLCESSQLCYEGVLCECAVVFMPEHTLPILKDKSKACVSTNRGLVQTQCLTENKRGHKEGQSLVHSLQ